MLPPSIYDNFDDAAEEQPNVGELSDEAIAVGASYAIPAFMREFIRRQNPDMNFKSEEQIALEEQAAKDDIALRYEQEVVGISSEDELEDVEPVQEEE